MKAKAAMHKSREDTHFGVPKQLLSKLRCTIRLVQPAEAATFSPAPRADAVDHNIAPVHFTRPINLLAICGISLPAGEDERGRPIGLQLAGRAGHDQALLEVSARAEAALASFPTTH